MFEDDRDLKRKHDAMVPAFPANTEHPDFQDDDYHTTRVAQAAGESADSEVKRFRASPLSGDEISSEDGESLYDSDGRNEELEEADESQAKQCACCDLSTSELMKKLDQVADKLAGRASDSRVTAIQLEIFENQVAALRAEGREVPNICRKVLRKHYRQHRISPLRSVAEDIRILELAERTLRRAGLAEEDEEGMKVLNSRGAAELCKLSKSKLDALKVYVSLDKIRKEEEANEGVRK